MARGYTKWISLWFSPVVILAAIPADIIELSLPDAGDLWGSDKLPLYRSVLEFRGRKHIRFAVKAGNDAHLLFSEKHVNMIDYDTDTNYFEIIIGGYYNTRCIIRVGTLSGSDFYVNTYYMLDSSTFKCFWVGWKAGVIVLGRGSQIGQHIVMQRSYSVTTDMKYVSVFSGFGSIGDWKVYPGMYIPIAL